MIFLEVELTHFGKFHNKKVVFHPGINIIYGENEMGKSTIHTFIKGMLFGIERARGRSKNDIYTKYEPWENQGGYEGKLRFKQNGIIYRIERSFLKTNKYVRLIDETNGAYLEPAEENLKKILGGLTETSYVNTMSIEQMKATTDSGLLEELRAYASNLSTTKNKSINVASAKECLKKQKKELERTIEKELDTEYVKILEQLEVTSSQLEQLKKESNECQKAMKETKEKEQLAINQMEQIEKQLGKREEDITYKLFSEKMEKEKQNNSENKKSMKEKKEKKKTGIGGFLVCAIGCIAIYLLLYNILETIFIPAISGVILFIVGFILWIINGKKRNKEDIQVQDSEDGTKQSISSQEFPQYVKSQLLGDSMYQQLLEKRNQVMNYLQQTKNGYEQFLEEEKKRQWIIEGKEDRIVELEEEKEELEKKKTQVAKTQKEIEAINLAIETMEEVETEIHQSFGNVLNEKISEIVSQITNKAYNYVVIKQGGEIFLNTEKRLIPIHQVSRGTIEQIYLAIRLAACNLLWEHGQMPILLDDVFAYYDDIRLKNTIEMLKTKWNGQVLIFTCHKREIAVSEC